MKISTKVLWYVLLSNILLVGVLFGIFNSSMNSMSEVELNNFRTDVEQQIQTKLKANVDIAYGILEQNYEQVQNGLLDLETAQNNAKAMISSLRYNNGRGYFWLNDTTLPYPNMIMHPIAPQLNGKVLNNPKYNVAMGKKQNLFQAMVEVTQNKGAQGFVDYLWPDPKDKSKTLPKLSYVKRFHPWGWIIGTGAYIDEIDKIVAQQKLKSEKEKNTSMFNALIWIALIFALTLLTGFLLTRQIRTRLKQIAHNLHEISEGDGDLTKKLDESGKDEIAEIAVKFNIFVEGLRTILRNVRENSSKIDQQLNTLSQESSDIKNAATAVNDHSLEVSQSVEKASNNMGEVTNSITELSSNTDSLAASVEEISITLDEVRNNCQNETQIAEEAFSLVGNAQGAMERLSGAAEKIGQIVDAIQKITDQTNLLALNATIEAASAGEAGKGFAVVAGEVKELARQSSSSAEEIDRQIEDIRQRTKDASEIIGGITEITTKLRDISQNILNSVDAQAIATREISAVTIKTSQFSSQITDNVQEASREMTEINGSVNRMNENSSQNASKIGSINNSTDQIKMLSNELAKIVSQFKL